MYGKDLGSLHQIKPETTAATSYYMFFSIWELNVIRQNGEQWPPKIGEGGRGKRRLEMDIHIVRLSSGVHNRGMVYYYTLCEEDTGGAGGLQLERIVKVKKALITMMYS